MRIGKKKQYVEVAGSTGRTNLSVKLWRNKNKLILVLLSHLKLQIIATVHDECLVKMEKTLYLHNNIFWERRKDHIHIQAYLVLMSFIEFLQIEDFVSPLLGTSLLEQFFQYFFSIHVSVSCFGKCHNISNLPPVKRLQFIESSDNS